VREVFGEVGDDLDEGVELVARTVGEVVARQQVERDDLDADVVAPLEELAHLGGTRAMPVGGGLIAELFGPPPVAVDDHGDVLGRLMPGQILAQALLIQVVQESRAGPILSSFHIATLVHDPVRVRYPEYDLS
jgi:hypothetical protein